MRRYDGFTLIELMVVMGIMILISFIVVSGSFGMTRSSSYRVAEDTVYNTLQAARQRACTDGKRVIVAFVVDRSKNYEDNAFSIVEAQGTITEPVDEPYIEDRCANLSILTKGGVDVLDVEEEEHILERHTIWNLRTGAHFTGFKFKWALSALMEIPGSSAPPSNSPSNYKYHVTRIKPISAVTFNKKLWRRGDPYGFQIAQSQALPRGFKIGWKAIGTSPASHLLVFEPDGTGFAGTSGEDGIQKEGDSATLILYEEISSRDEDKAIRITFNRGIVSVDG